MRERVHCVFSVAILRFICGTQKFDDHWYPIEPRARARVDEFLAWQHVGLRGKAVPVSSST